MTVFTAAPRDTAATWPTPPAPAVQPAFASVLSLPPREFADSAGTCTAYDAVKRLIDIVVASLLLVLLGPLMAAVALAIRMTSPGGALFRQLRAGQHGRPFLMYKFRSMRIGSEQHRHHVAHLNQMAGSPVFKAPEDPRITPLGRWLRRTSIDELPQLFNVLAGQMSLVGPRPLWLPEAQQAGLVSQMRTSVKPGLTCLWQISGRSELGYEQWVHLDLYYIQRRSLLLDLLIMCQTAPIVLSGRGAY